MTGVPTVRVLSDGRAFLADFFNRRLAMVDPDFKSVETLFDANTPAPLTYPAGFAQLVAAHGDTTLFYDANARGYRVLDPSGRVVRRLSVADMSIMRAVQAPGAAAVIDPQGRLIIATQRSNFDKPVSGMQPQAESLMIARITLDRMGWDSVTAIMGSGQKVVPTGDTALRPRPVIITMPAVQRNDVWAMMPGGTIAIVRSGDFHVDWIAPDGSRRSSPSVPWAWKTYTKSERDSVRASLETVNYSIVGRTVSGAAPPLPMTRVLDTLPERMPAFGGTARADLEGRIWIPLGERLLGPLPSTPVVYGIIDSTGRMVERVELPANRVLVGFAGAGAVYAVTPTGTRDGFALERYRYRKP